jgi:hypothetical protein
MLRRHNIIIKILLNDVRFMVLTAVNMKNIPSWVGRRVAW